MATVIASSVTKVALPLGGGLVAGLLSWFFEFQIRDFVESSPWVIPLLVFLGVSGLGFWLTLAA